MDFKLFLSTFALIFLAELGDKTQLAAMAASAGSRSPWSIFFGASVALVLSTLIAILFGSTLQRYVPQHYLRGGAAILFFLFGAFLLVSAFKVRAEKSADVKEATVKTGLIGRLFISIAHDFEKASSLDYEKLAAQAQDDSLKALFFHLAEEERSHLGHIGTIAHQAEEIKWQATDHTPEPIQTPADITDTQSSGEIVSAAIEHEKKTAAFYRTLAEAAPLASIRKASLKLAEEEDSHVAHLEEYAEHGTFGHSS